VPGLSFEISIPVLAALIAGGLIPLYLILFAGVSPLRRADIRMTAAGVTAVVVWAGALSLASPGLQGHAGADLAAGLLILGCAFMGFMMLWGLLTRGFTLSLLVALAKAERPMSMVELADGYGGGQGASFFADKRITGLRQLGFIREAGDQVRLTAFPGVLSVMCFRVLKLIFAIKD